jgi:single-stranded-DNA-specific exonuclease
MDTHAAPLLTAPLLFPHLSCDAELHIDDITPAFMNWLTRCGPFGIGNPEPILLTRNLTLSTPIRLIQEKDVSLTLCQGDDKTTVSAIGWTRRTDWRERCEALALQPGSRIDIAYRLKEKSNPRFPGLDLELVDLRLASPDTHPN